MFLIRRHAPSWGAKDPVVTIEWFGDYQSPWNERVAPTMVDLEKAGRGPRGQ